jgi:hypothetical protein
MESLSEANPSRLELYHGVACFPARDPVSHAASAIIISEGKVKSLIGHLRRLWRESTAGGFGISAIYGPFNISYADIMCPQGNRISAGCFRNLICYTAFIGEIPIIVLGYMRRASY